MKFKNSKKNEKFANEWYRSKTFEKMFTSTIIQAELCLFIRVVKFVFEKFPTLKCLRQLFGGVISFSSRFTRKDRKADLVVFSL